MKIILDNDEVITAISSYVKPMLGLGVDQTVEVTVSRTGGGHTAEIEVHSVKDVAQFPSSTEEPQLPLEEEDEPVFG